MIDWNGFDKGVIGKKLPSDKTLNNMRKADLIEYLHMAEHNHNVLAFAYRNAVDNSKCNRCPLPKMTEEHDKQIREETIDKCISIAKENSYEVDIDTPPYQETEVRLVDFMDEARKLKEQNK